MNENAIELVGRAIADDPHTSIQEITEICYLSRGTIHRRRTRYEKGVCKVGTPLPDTGTKKWRE